ncbi:hypothetical protein GGF38_004160 [Coemansia sp. RSA 25]|nr:hypothetical protein GGF38_004160 [Coemansia sp. RSA 25]
MEMLSSVQTSPTLHRAPCGRRNAKAPLMGHRFILGTGMPSMRSQLGNAASPCGVLAAIHDRTRRNVPAGHMAAAQPVVSSAVQSPISDS